MRALRRPGETVVVWLAATFGCLLYLLAGPYSNYGPAGFLDPWFYTGYFTNFSYLVRQIGPTYFVSRLPWILPGVGAFRVLPPEAASVLLNLAIAAVSAVSLYWAVRWHYGRAPGVAASAMLVANPYFMCTVCWDYPDGPAIAYAFAALAFAVRPHGSRARNTVLAGFFLALSGLTNMSGGPMILAVAAVPLMRQRGSVREWIREAACLGAGGIAAIVALCPVSQALFGRWTYFYWQIFQTISALGNHDYLAKMWGTGNAFLLGAYRLFAPALLLVLGPVYLACRKPRASAWPAYFSLLICAGLYAFQEFALHGAALRVEYHSSYMIVPLMWLVGVAIGERGISWREAAIAAIVALGVPYYLRVAPPVAHPWLVLAAAGALAAAAFALPRVPVAACLLATVLALSPALDGSCQFAWDHPGGTPNVEVFRDLMTFERDVNSALDPSHPIRFWWDNDEPAWPFYNSAASLYLWMREDFTRDLAGWPAEKLRDVVRPNLTFVHLTLDPSRLAGRVRLLESRGIRVGNERRLTMPYRGGKLYIVLQDVVSM